MFNVIRKYCENRFFTRLNLPAPLTPEYVKLSFCEKAGQKFNIYNRIHRELIEDSIIQTRSLMNYYSKLQHMINEAKANGDETIIQMPQAVPKGPSIH